MELSKKQKILRSLLVILGIAAFFGIIFLMLKLTGWWESINSVQKVKRLILDLGFWGRFMFVLLQFLQVTFIPLPASAVVIAGSLIYGPFEASLLSLAGILLGSTLAFFLGRTFGRKLVIFMVGEKTCDKWVKFLSKGKYSFVIMMLLPLFPDDVLCLVAGLTNMSWLFFMTTQFVTRTIGIFLMSYFSSGEIIPYEGWGIYAWILIAVVAIVSIFLTTKYQLQIESRLAKLFKKKN